MTTLAAAAAAEERSFVGVWSGISGTDVYTKLVVTGLQRVTYCYVQSCQQQECSDWIVVGTTDASFHFQNEIGRWDFDRVSDRQIEGRFTNFAGGTSRVTYRPE